ncbi:COG4315 family predicted lipoprotein [Crenobacter cavernae]|uniref:Lipoprotein n=1 Tax=Crenobacter cavernae TaxID=2290923 RepID=A0ABY0FAW3_9NEIS|nr:hypothetical protein [Crenobacter cavernae]RXZ42776.1 hypothetical protein EBB06_12870 [Crenobacter cavernae]
MRYPPIYCALAARLSASAWAEAPAAMDGRLVDEHKMTLYVFDKDTAGKSACEAACTAKWPPAYAGSYDKASGDWSFVTRGDGKRQWAYKGRPLYRWSMDTRPGEAKGDGINGVWHTAKP